MIKVGNTTIEAMEETCHADEFFSKCERLTTHIFMSKGEIAPFSMFWIQSRMLLANWDFANIHTKTKSLQQARVLCQTLRVTKYFFASEVWMKSLKKDDPDFKEKMDTIKNNGVIPELDKIEKLTMIMENKGEESMMVNYDIVRIEGNARLQNRIIVDNNDIASSRLTGMLC